MNKKTIRIAGAQMSFPVGAIQINKQTILNCFEADCRLVLVITGKGLTRNSTGVLRKRLPEWLNKPKCREVTLSFCAARPEHGGEGAFYILLKRKRNRH